MYTMWLLIYMISMMQSTLDDTDFVTFSEPLKFRTLVPTKIAPLRHTFKMLEQLQFSYLMIIKDVYVNKHHKACAHMYMFVCNEGLMQGI